MTKAQMFYTDLMISISIFATAIVLFLVFSNNLGQDDDAFKLIVADAETISSSLLSTGEPYNWTPANVSKIGLTSEPHRLDINKVEGLMNMSPSTAAGLFGSNFNYAIFFKSEDGNVLNFNNCILNNIGLVVENITESICSNFTITPSKHLVSIERLVVYDSDIVKIVVQTWI